jgi:nicotinamidase-related amidase
MTNPRPDNAALLFLDLQVEIVPNSRTLDVATLRRTTGVLAKLAALHGIPAFLSAVPPGGAFFPEVTGPLGDAQPRFRQQTSAFADAGLVEALRAAGRHNLLLAGVASEIVVQRTALDALAAGFATFIVVDACGGLGARTEDAAWRRIGAAGGITTSVPTFAAELTGDFASEVGGATLALMYQALSS